MTVLELRVAFSFYYFLTSPLKPGLVFVDPLIGYVAQRGLPHASSNRWKPDVAFVLIHAIRSDIFWFVL